MFYSFPYLILIVFYIIFFLLEDKFEHSVSVKKRIRLICALLFFVFFGFRGYIGSDWPNYEHSYSVTSWKEWTITDYEIGYSSLAKTFAYFGIRYFNFVAFITAIQVLLLNRFLSRHSKLSAALFYLVLIALFPVLIIDLQRNFLSILLVINGIGYLNEGSNRRFYLYVAAGMLFHLSAIVFCILPYLDRFKFKKGVLITLFVFGVVVYFLQINFYKDILSAVAAVVGGRFGYLIEQSTADSEVAYGLTIGIIEKIILYIVIINFYPRLSNDSRLFINTCVIYLLIYFYFSTSQSFINRFANLFFWGYIIAYDILRGYFTRLKLNFVFMSSFLLFCLLRVYIGYNSTLYRYVNVLFEDENRSIRVYDRNAHYFGK